MPIDPSIPLGIRPPQPIDPEQVWQAGQQQQLNQQRLQMNGLELRQRLREAEETQKFGEAMKRGASWRELERISPKLHFDWQKNRLDIEKRQYDARKAAIDAQRETAKMFGSLAATVRDTPTLHGALNKARELQLIDDTAYEYGMKSGFTPEVSSWLQQAVGQAMTVQEQMAEAQRVLENERKAAEERRSQQRHDAELPGVVAGSQMKQLETAATSVGGVQTQADYDQWRAGLPPEIRDRVPPMFSPTVVRWVEKMGMSPAARATAEASARSAEETARHNRAQEQLAASGQELTRRGQDLTDVRVRDGVRLRAENRPPSAAEQKVYNFYSRLADANSVLEGQQDTVSQKGMFGQLYQEYAPNWAKSANDQIYQQAQRQFTEARLRKESGAAIAASEYENDRKTYFPQPGDTKEVLERKARARRVLMEATLRESGRAGQVYGQGAQVAEDFGAAELGFKE